MIFSSLSPPCKSLSSFCSFYIFLTGCFLVNSIALKRFFYPVLKLASKLMFPSSSEQSSIENQIESLLKLLYSQKGLPLCKFVEKLCQEMESLAMNLNKHFIFHETEVLYCHLFYVNTSQ